MTLSTAPLNSVVLTTVPPERTSRMVPPAMTRLVLVTPALTVIVGVALLPCGQWGGAASVLERASPALTRDRSSTRPPGGVINLS